MPQELRSILTTPLTAARWLPLWPGTRARVSSCHQESNSARDSPPAAQTAWTDSPSPRRLSNSFASSFTVRTSPRTRHSRESGNPGPFVASRQPGLRLSPQ